MPDGKKALAMPSLTRNAPRVLPNPGPVRVRDAVVHFVGQRLGKPHGKRFGERGLTVRV